MELDARPTCEETREDFHTRRDNLTLISDKIRRHDEKYFPPRWLVTGLERGGVRSFYLRDISFSEKIQTELARRMRRVYRITESELSDIFFFAKSFNVVLLIWQR